MVFCITTFLFVVGEDVEIVYLRKVLCLVLKEANCLLVVIALFIDNWVVTFVCFVVTFCIWCSFHDL